MVLPDHPMRVAVTPWPAYELLYFGQHRGLLPEDDVRLIALSAPGDAYRMMQNGAVDAAALTLDVVLKLRAVGVDVRVVAVMDISLGADTIIARSPVTSMQGLRGKRIGVETASIGDLMLVRALEKNGMTLSDVTIVPMDFSAHEASFVDGKVDAIVTFEPVRSKLLAVGGNEVFTSAQIPDEIVDVLVVRGDFIKERPAAVKKLVLGWMDSVAAMRQENAEAVAFMAARERLTPAEFKVAVSGMDIPTQEVNRRLLGGSEPVLLRSAIRLVRVMKDKGLLGGEPDLSVVFDASFLEDTKS
jgi:NitT/TauT family transport system substrate-binding protein